ncbi:MAG: AAA family ATPase [Chloroflexi bacterium]|nr:AAA family ATPase [Chloroflexota bacterium]MCI0577278.1 AAA family ATPase [Chloroflexota bacterium]MCI0649873.1 AAA family ATPase [Chloroflexota bacterium]MCI0731031.1 AAA family ATPase [Chloroflexota bacterium]
MKLIELRIQNYRSLEDVKLALRDLAVLIGPNGAGKTSLLELLQLLQRGSQQELGSFLESQGGFQAILRHGATTKRLKVEVDIDVQSEKSGAPMHYQFELAAEQVGYLIAAERLEWQFDPRAPKPFRYIDVHHNKLYYADPEETGLVQPDWDYDRLELGLAQVPKMYREPETLRSLLAGARHYSFLDVSPRAPVRLPQSLTLATRPGPNGENLYSALYNLRASHDDVYERILSLLQQGYPDFKRLEFPVVGAGQVTLVWHEQGKSNKPFYPNQLSEGTLRFLWLVTTLLSPSAPPIVLFDEPEVSLHPELLKLLAALLQDASAGSQIVVATHSPDLIRWLQPDEVLIADKEDGVSRFTWADELDLEEWLAEYTLRDLWLMGNLGGRP